MVCLTLDKYSQSLQKKMVCLIDPIFLSFLSEPSEHTNALHILDSLLRNYDRRATPTNHLGKFELPIRNW